MKIQLDHKMNHKFNNQQIKQPKSSRTLKVRLRSVGGDGPSQNTGVQEDAAATAKKWYVTFSKLSIINHLFSYFIKTLLLQS